MFLWWRAAWHLPHAGFVSHYFGNLSFHRIRWVRHQLARSFLRVWAALFGWLESGREASRAFEIIIIWAVIDGGDACESTPPKKKKKNKLTEKSAAYIYCVRTNTYGPVHCEMDSTSHIGSPAARPSSLSLLYTQSAILHLRIFVLVSLLARWLAPSPSSRFLFLVPHPKYPTEIAKFGLCSVPSRREKAFGKSLVKMFI